LSPRTSCKSTLRSLRADPRRIFWLLMPKCDAHFSWLWSLPLPRDGELGVAAVAARPSLLWTFMEGHEGAASGTFLQASGDLPLLDRIICMNLPLLLLPLLSAPLTHLNQPTQSLTSKPLPLHYHLPRLPYVGQEDSEPLCASEPGFWRPQLNRRLRPHRQPV